MEAPGGTSRADPDADYKDEEDYGIPDMNEEDADADDSDGEDSDFENNEPV